jgi:hypothetical protein
VCLVVEVEAVVDKLLDIDVGERLWRAAAVAAGTALATGSTAVALSTVASRAVTATGAVGALAAFGTGSTLAATSGAVAALFVPLALTLPRRSLALFVGFGGRRFGFRGLGGGRGLSRSFHRDLSRSRFGCRFRSGSRGFCLRGFSGGGGLRGLCFLQRGVLRFEFAHITQPLP